MSALLAMFSSVPPILRRKAGELLATIRNALKSHSLEGPKVIEPPQPISIVEPSKADITQVQEQPRVTTNDLFPSTSSPGWPVTLALK